jgi:N-acetylglucosamine-6-phosphate deacetylase
LKAYLADQVFTGEKWVEHHAVITDHNQIIDVIPVARLSSEIPVAEFKDGFLAPAFIDLQIYGANGKLFSVFPTRESLQLLNDYCRNSGTAFCLPTVATNKKEIFYGSIDAVKKYWDETGEGLPTGRLGILGLHIEGPWISKEKRGAHIESFIHSPTFAEVEELMLYGKGVIKMITLAPEVCSDEVVDCILSHGVIISAGHSNASYEQAIRSFDKGITTVTHLFNAMSGLHHRAPGLVGAAFDSNKIMASIIPDGHHVDYAAVRIAKKIMGDRLFAITDAVTETNRGNYQHQPAGDKYEAGGILSGSALTMNKALQNLVNHTGVELSEAINMCSLYPARVLRMENELGKIQKGFKANMVLLDENLQALKTILA